MSVYFDSYFGENATGATPAQANAVLTVTDGEISVSWLANPGYTLLFDGYQDSTASFKGGGVYSSSPLADGGRLKHVVFDDVVASFSFALRFSNTDDMQRRIDELEELLLVRAPRYWTDRHYHKPVWIERSLDGESNTSYALVDSAVGFERPNTYFDNTVPINQTLLPFRVSIRRKPFWEGAKPGTSQRAVELSAVQAWNFNRSWGTATSTPAGQIFDFAELDTGNIYAGGESEILLWNGSGWAVVATSPVTLSENVTAVLLLQNGDLLFGGNGRIVKLSGSTWSEETTLPSGQVWDIIETTTGELFAADNGQVLKRDSGGTWSVHNNTIFAGQVYSLHEASSGRVYAGETGQIVRTAVQAASSEFKVKVSQSTDDAEQRGSNMDLVSNDLDFFDSTSHWIGVRFQGVTIPAGATINSAKIRFTAEGSDSGTGGAADIYCELNATPATFSSSSNDISTRSLTTARSDWSSVETWRKGEKYDTTDFAAALQEVVDLGGWSSGNSIAVLFDITSSGGDRDAVPYDKTPGDAPELIITYSTALAATDTWELNSTLPTGNVRSLGECDGTLLAGENGRVLSSTDDGDTWGVSTTAVTDEVRALAMLGQTIYAGDNGNVRKSTDCGNNWTLDTTSPTGYVHAVLIAASDSTVYAGNDGSILSLSATDFDLGQTATTNNQVMVANHHSEANLTHILNDDGGVFASIYPASSLPLTLFPSSAVANDALYFGCDTSLDDSGPFAGLVLNLATAASATTSYTVAWEYWDGSAWVSLTVQDGSASFSLVGVSLVAWEMPSDWVTTTVDSTAGYWVRARLSAVSGTFTNPTQAERDIYAPVTAFAEVAATQTKGNISSIAKIQLANRSDGDGPGGSAPDLYATRLIMGAKATADHAAFRAFLNFSDEQNPNGVSVSTAVDTDSATSLVNSTGAATGRSVFFDASSATLDSLVDRAAITLNTTVARDYYGTYRVFLRGRQSGGSAGEVSVRLKVVSGSGGISALTETQALQSTDDHELIEFEELVHLPVSSLLTSSELGDEMQIVLQVAASQNDADFYAYDLFLLPTDKMYIDSWDTANTSNSAVGNGARLTVDSVTIPKLIIRSLVQKTASGATKANYIVDSNGQVRLLEKQAQRLWLLAARTISTSSSVWVSPPEMVHSAQVWATDRWLTGRGGS